MNTAECMAEVKKIDADLAAFVRSADIDNLADLDTAMALAARAEHLMDHVEEMAAAGGMSTETLAQVAHTAQSYRVLRQELGTRRAHLTMRQAIADAARSTRH